MQQKSDGLYGCTGGGGVRWCIFVLLSLPLFKSPQQICNFKIVRLQKILIRQYGISLTLRLILKAIKGGV